MIRGGHLDVTVLDGLQVDATGRLANWMVLGKLVPGMGGAMDLMVGAARVIVAMQHAVKGQPKIVASLTLPPTATRRVSFIVTEMAVIEPTTEGPLLRERVPGVTVDDIVANTGAKLLIRGDVPEMPIGIPDPVGPDARRLGIALDEEAMPKAARAFRVSAPSCRPG